MRATREARGGAYHQEQAVLRNNVSDINSLWQLTKIWWSWRSGSSWRARPSFNLFFLGLLHLAAFGAAGILAFRITGAGNQVLIARSSNCGPWYPIFAPLSDVPKAKMDAFQSYLDIIAVASEDYVQNCLADPRSLPECGKYQTRQLNWTSTKISCPFGELCLGPANSTLQMTTGLLDSRDDFGINSGNEDRVHLRKVATCIPITADGYTSNGTTTIYYTNMMREPGAITVNYTAAFYGATGLNLSDVGILDPGLQNMTYMYTNFREAATPYYENFAQPYDVE
jgi:hypothetical protein